MKAQIAKMQYPSFYVDDSSCEIAGTKHVILAAVAFPDEDKAIEAWLRKKQEFGISPYTEVKWNDSSVSLECRRDFVPLVNSSIGIVVIDDSDKQSATERLCSQIWHFCNEETKGGFRLRFDKNIVEDRDRLQNYLRALYPPCVGMSQHDSAHEQLLQYADFLAGAIKLKVDFGLGTRDPNRKITVSGEDPGSRVQMEQSAYFFGTLRYCLWGRILDCGDGVNTYEPRKSVLGRGLLIHSSATVQDLNTATTFIDGDYMGCLH
jgi:hypothetical protein